MKSSLDRYNETSQIESIIQELSERNSSAEKLPLLRKPFQFNPSFKTVTSMQGAELQSKNWTERREKSKKVKSSALIDLLKALFNSLEVDTAGKVRGLHVVEQLIFLGLATEPAAFMKILSAAFKEPEISKLKLSLEDMMLFCSGDRKTDNILDKLNFSSDKSRQKRNSPAPGIKILKNSVFEAEHRKNNTISSHPEKKFSTITMADHLTVINGWWKEVDLKNENFAESEEVAHLLVEKGIVANTLDAKRMLGPSEHKHGKISYQQFQQVFARSVLKGALSSLVGRLSEGPLSKPYFTVSMKLSAYKRRLLIARIRPDEGQITKAEGENALKAIEKYKKYVRSISPSK